MRGCIRVLLSAVLAVYLFGCGDDSKQSSRCESDQVFAQVGEEAGGCYARCPEGVCSPGLVCVSEVCVPVVSNPNNQMNSNNTSPNNQTILNNTTTNNQTNPNNSTTNNQTRSNNSSTNNQTNPNNSTLNNATNNETNNPTNNTTNNNNNNNTNPAQLQALCEQACDRLYGSCITDNCTLSAGQSSALQSIYMSCLSGGANGPTCVQQAADPEVKLALDELLTRTCNDLSPLRCGEFGLTEECSCQPPSSLGGACLTSSDCSAGDLSPFCIAEQNSMGQPTGFNNGYCSAVPCPIRDSSVTEVDIYTEPACGAGNLCVVFPTANGLASYCEKGCDGGCRTSEGYACQIQTIEADSNQNPVFVGSCNPACQNDADCGMTSRCDLQTGRCELPCGETPIGGTAGNPTLTQLCINSGGACTLRPNNSSYCVLP